MPFFTTSPFVEKFMNFSFKSINFWLDSEWKYLMGISFYADSNRVAIIADLSQLITILPKADFM